MPDEPIYQSNHIDMQSDSLVLKKQPPPVAPKPLRQQYIPNEYNGGESIYQNSIMTERGPYFRRTSDESHYSYDSHYLDDKNNRYPLNDDRLMINNDDDILRRTNLEHERRLQELQEELRLQKERECVPPPPPAPPVPPILPSASQNVSAAPSTGNTLKKYSYIEKPPYSLDEVLKKSTELKVRRDKRASLSSSLDPMLDDTFKRQKEFQKALNKKLTNLKDSQVRQENMARSEYYSVGDMISQNKALENTGAFKSRPNSKGSNNSSKSSSNSPQSSPSILGRNSGTLSRPTRNRFEHVAKMFEKQKESIRNPSKRQTYGSLLTGKSESAFVDQIFGPVFAGEDHDLLSSDALTV